MPVIHSAAAAADNHHCKVEHVIVYWRTLIWLHFWLVVVDCCYRIKNYKCDDNAIQRKLLGVFIFYFFCQTEPESEQVEYQSAVHECSCIVLSSVTFQADCRAVWPLWSSWFATQCDVKPDTAPHRCSQNAPPSLKWRKTSVFNTLQEFSAFYLFFLQAFKPGPLSTLQSCKLEKCNRSSHCNPIDITDFFLSFWKFSSICQTSIY